MSNSVVIFDIDGVIVDSEQLHFDVLKEVVPEQTVGVKAEDLIGLSLDETLDNIGIGKDHHRALTDQIIKIYKQKIGPKYLRPEVKLLVQMLCEKHIPVGFVSTAPRDVCLTNLAILGLSTAYSVPLISGDDVSRTKPYPDPYLAMLKILKVEASQVIVIEDTDLGIEAAVGAGIQRVYGWPHALSGTESYCQASNVITALHEVEEFNEMLCTA
jgi:beta-phosphoglucomutase